MKKIYMIIIGLFCLGLTFGMGYTAYADEVSSAVETVTVTVDPNIGVQPLAMAVDAGTIQTGNFSALLTFRIDANSEQVGMMIEASGLYKGADPTSTMVTPIPVNSSVPVMVMPTYGNAMNNMPNELPWTETVGDPIQGFPTIQTQTVDFESAENGTYSQNVSYQISYNQDDPEKPIGQYTGKVRLTVMLIGSPDFLEHIKHVKAL
jgi:hypothetical protein